MTKAKPKTRGAKRWQTIKSLIADGRCRACGKKRGPRGTSQHCGACKDKHNALLRERYRRAFEAARRQATTDATK